MKNRYRIYIREKYSGGKIWWIQDSQTGQRESLKTTDKAEAKRLLDAKNQPHHFAGFHVQLAKTHLLVSDPDSASRTWQSVMDSIIGKKFGSTRIRWERAAKSKSFNPIRNLLVYETRAADFERVLNCGKCSANAYLRRLHNYAMDMNWLLSPVIAKRAWPKIRHKEKRAITSEEHRKIIERETNPERSCFYELCWHIGAAQSDVAGLTADDIDWNNYTISFNRIKTGSNSSIAIGSELEALLRKLPNNGPLFPYLATVRESDRATEFKQRCNGLKITGVTLHSYRYAWAERAKAAGYPERFAQAALGHGSKAIARAYAKNGHVALPSLESYETRNHAETNVVPMTGQTDKAA